MEKVWLKNYDYFVPESIRYPQIPLYQLLEMTCVKYDENVATIFFDQKLTYGELRDHVRRLAAALKGMGAATQAAGTLAGTAAKTAGAAMQGQMSAAGQQAKGGGAKLLSDAKAYLKARNEGNENPEGQ